MANQVPPQPGPQSELVPLVMIPRFTTFAGRASAEQCFSTIGMDVTEYAAVGLNVWRGAVVGAQTPGFRIWLEESTDQNAWHPCEGKRDGRAGFDPGEDHDEHYEFTLRRRWFRVRIQLGGRDNVVTCWAVGFLHIRRAKSEGVLGFFRR